jgi:hypothetical protein
MSNKPLNWGWFIIGILKQNLCYPTSLALDCARHPDPLWKFLHGSQHCGHALLAAPTLVPWASKPVAFKGKIRKITTNIDKQWSIVGSFLTENPEAEKNLMPHPICRSFRPVVGTHPSRLSSSPQNCKNTSALSLSRCFFCFEAASAEHSLAFLCLALVFDPQLFFEIIYLMSGPEVVIIIHST